MAIHKIKTTLNTTVLADKAHDTWIVTETGKVDALGIGIDASGPAKGREIVVNGEVYGTGWAISLGAESGKGGSSLLIGKEGIVGSVNDAILSNGNGQHIVNRGTIDAVEGVVSHGNRLHVVNNGTFATDDVGILIEEGTARIVNNGTMNGDTAIRADEAGAGRVVLINNGVMDTTVYSLQLWSDAGHLIRNRGEITNSIHGGDGRDRFINEGGTMSGTVDLRGGNDTYIVDRSDIDIAEGSGDGIDTVRASVDFKLGEGIDRLVLTGRKNTDGLGSSDDNRLFGNAGKNRLDGDGGNDILRGGGGADTFVFSYHGGQDEILDFRSGQDRIDLSGFNSNGIDSFADLKAAASNKGGDLLIEIGSEELLIHDFTKADLDKADFII